MPAPKPLLFGCVLFVGLVLTLAFYFLALIPYTGFTLVSSGSQDYLQVATVQPWVEEAGLHPGDLVTTLDAADGSQLVIQARHVTRLPAERRAYYPDQRAFFSELAKVYSVLSQSAVDIHLENGRTVSLQLDHDRPLEELSPKFWSRMIYGTLVWLLGAFVWAWQPHRRETAFALLAGLGLLLVWAFPISTMGTEEMYYLPPAVAMLTSLLRGIGLLLFGTAFVCMLFYFPQQLPDARRWTNALGLGIGAYALWALFNDWESGLPLSRQHFYLEEWEIYLLSPLTALTGMLCCVLQWQKSRHMPVERAQIQWVLISAAIGPLVWVVFVFFPIYLGNNTPLSLTIAPLPILISYAMVVFGVARLRYFHVEQYVGSFLQWSLWSLGFSGLCLWLLSSASISIQSVLLLLFAGALWLFIPLWLILRRSFGRQHQEKTQRLFQQVSTRLIRRPDAHEKPPVQLWREVLCQVFDPLACTEDPAITASTIAQRGRQLCVAANRFSPALTLDSAWQGSRLFRDEDLEAVQAMYLLFEQTMDFQDAYLTGLVQERNRISRDLHDQIGSKLLSLIYSATDDRSRRLAKETMEQLREILQALKSEAVTSRQLVAELRHLCDDVCENFGLSLEWSDELASDTLRIGPALYLNILNITRELLNNTARHAQATQVSITLLIGNDEVSLCYQDNGRGFSVDETTMGNGIRNIRSRVREMNGNVEWIGDEPLTVQLHIPLSDSDLQSALEALHERT